MMGVLMVIFSFFAAYGIVQLLARGIFRLRTGKGKKPVCLHRVLGVQNAEDSVEGIVRTLTWEDAPEELIVLDIHSTDETAEILNRLCRQYTQLRVMSPEEYTAYIAKICEK